MTAASSTPARTLAFRSTRRASAGGVVDRWRNHAPGSYGGTRCTTLVAAMSSGSRSGKAEKPAIIQVRAAAPAKSAISCLKCRSGRGFWHGAGERKMDAPSRMPECRSRSLRHLRDKPLHDRRPRHGRLAPGSPRGAGADSVFVPPTCAILAGLPTDGRSGASSGRQPTKNGTHTSCLPF